MAGLNRETFKMLSGWGHLAQSLRVLVTTALEARVMRRHVGSRLPRLVDAPISPATLIDFYAATAGAIVKHEPRFRVTRMSVEDATAGSLSLLAEGIYFPRGHLGDFNVREPRQLSVPL